MAVKIGENAQAEWLGGFGEVFGYLGSDYLPLISNIIGGSIAVSFGGAYQVAGDGLVLICVGSVSFVDAGQPYPLVDIQQISATTGAEGYEVTDLAKKREHQRGLFLCMASSTRSTVPFFKRQPLTLCLRWLLHFGEGMNWLDAACSDGSEVAGSSLGDGAPLRPCQVRGVFFYQAARLSSRPQRVQILLLSVDWRGGCCFPMQWHCSASTCKRLFLEIGLVGGLVALSTPIALASW